jgi:hypothetical protein
MERSVTVPVLAAVTSVVALTVSIITLWLTQLRKGEIVAAPPKSWAGSITERKAIIMFPLALTNTGARGKVILDFRLVVTDDPDRPLEWVRTRPELRPEKGEPSFPAPTVIEGATAGVHFVEFQREPGRTPEVGTWTARIDVEVMDTPGEWQPLLEFPWTVTPQAARNLSAFLAHDNPAG